MAEENSGDLMRLVILAGLGLGGYFIWEKYFKEEEEKKGFIGLSYEFIPPTAAVGETITGTIIGKNKTEESYLCFIKLTNQATGELLAPLQSAQVGAGLSKQFIFEFEMPDTRSLRFNIHFGRIIEGKEKIDDTQVFTIDETEPGYPKDICRSPYCFIVYTQEQEIQMKEFLGLEPSGADMDTYLANSTQTQLDFWKGYWVEIWTNLHRSDIVEFVILKYNQYSGIVSTKIHDLQIMVS